MKHQTGAHPIATWYTHEELQHLALIAGGLGALIGALLGGLGVYVTLQ